MDIKQALNEVITGHDLERKDMHDVMQTIMQGEATPAQIGGLLVALRLKGESVGEISAAAQVMRELAEKVTVDNEYLVDTCGTGGDGANTFNISTCSAFVTAASGAKVAKHGNRSVSSKSGSADVLEAAGIELSLNAEQVASCIKEVGIGFMFAPMHHSAMKHAIGPRRELGIRTLFNVLGPLTNPAGAPNQVIGVFSKDWLIPLAETLKLLGSEHVMIVHAHDGMDEISIATPTDVVELNNGDINSYTIAPDDFGFTAETITNLAVNDVNESLGMLNSVLNNNANTAAKNIVCLNAGAAIYVSGKATSLDVGISNAKELIESGAAKQKLDELITFTEKFK
ncbi:MAG: anthranilate phosphoribosyltransferase [Pseudomonadota bacterium]